MAQLQEREERRLEGLSHPGGPGRREGAGAEAGMWCQPCSSRAEAAGAPVPRRGLGADSTCRHPPSDHECGTRGRCLGPRPFCIMGHVGFAWDGCCGPFSSHRSGVTFWVWKVVRWEGRQRATLV